MEFETLPTKYLINIRDLNLGLVKRLMSSKSKTTSMFVLKRELERESKKIQRIIDKRN